MRPVFWLCALSVPLAATLVCWFTAAPLGTVRVVPYSSKTTLSQRKAIVYLPPGYQEASRYPVLYLLHGADNDPRVWLDKGNCHRIMDCLHAMNALVPMIVVLPDGFAGSDATGNRFVPDLLDDLVPFIDEHFATQANREGRAIAGVSLGGGQALRIGLRHPETFAWIGGFSASFGKGAEDVLAASEKLPEPPKLLWVSCGNRDSLLAIDRSFSDELTTRKVPHVWHVGKGGHEWSVWQDDLKRFAPLLFR